MPKNNITITAEVESTPLAVAVTGAPGSAGVALAHSAASSSLLMTNNSTAAAIQYKIGTGPWETLVRQAGVTLPTNLAVTPLYLRRGTYDGGVATVDLVIDGVPSIKAGAGSVVTGAEDTRGSFTGLQSPEGRIVQFPSRLALPKWRASVGKVRDGSATAKLAVIGSSTSAGQGAGTRPKGLVARLTQMLNTYYAPATSGGIFGGSFASTNTLATFDTRITFGAGWVASTTDNPLGSFAFKNSTDTTGLLQFTPMEPFNIVDVYVKKVPGSGTLTVSIDGGVTPLTTSGSGAEELAFVRVSGIAVGTHTVSLRATALGTDGVEVYAIRTYNTTQRAIDVFQWAHSGGTAQNFLQTGKPWSAYNAINRYAPDLALFVVASNVWTGNQPLATFKAQMQSLISRLKETSDVGLIAGIPTLANDVPLAVQQQYVDATQELAVLNGLPFIDNWRRFGSWEQANANGLMFDGGHLNGPGYSDFATPIFKLLTEV